MLGAPLMKSLVYGTRMEDEDSSTSAFSTGTTWFAPKSQPVLTPMNSRLPDWVSAQNEWTVPISVPVWSRTGRSRRFWEFSAVVVLSVFIWFCS